MTASQRLGLGLAPLLLRLVLGAVFIWAGSSKLFVTDVYPPEQAATLASLGILSLDDAVGAEPEPVPDPEPQTPMERGLDELENPTEPAGTATSAALTRSPAIILAQNEDGPVEGAVSPGMAYSADDFPDGAEARRLYSLALLLHARANPGPDGTPLWPDVLASNTVLKYMPWVAAVVEFVCGIFVIFGLLTRLSALGLAGVMATALLLTTIGPAAVSGDGFLGFLPDPQFRDPGAWVAAWQTMFFQLTTGVIALALVFTGAGWLSFDQRMAGRKSKGDGDDS